MAFRFYTPYTVNAAQVSTNDQSNFPVGIIDNTGSTNLKFTSYGGHVQNLSGFDIRPYSDASLSTPLTFELVYYDPTTGKIEMWVKIPTLSHTVNTVIYLAYGDASLDANGSSTATWSNSFAGVWHLSNGTVLTATDSTGGAAAGTVTGITATTGQIDGAGNATGGAGTDNINITHHAGIDGIVALTISFWYNITIDATFRRFYAKGGQAFMGNGTSDLGFGTLGWSGTQGAWDITGPTGGAWHKCDVTYNFGSTANIATIYIDGVSQTLITNTAPTGTYTHADGDMVFFNNASSGGIRELNGKMDEFRMSSVVRPVDWILTAYRNEFAPTTFYTVGTEVGLSSSWTL